ncbi:MAG: hypothetical protein ABIT09_07750 [Croceibacterium sp.]
MIVAPPMEWQPIDTYRGERDMADIVVVVCDGKPRRAYFDHDEQNWRDADTEAVIEPTQWRPA